MNGLLSSGAKKDSKYTTILFLSIAFVLIFNSIKTFQGFTHVDEPNLVYDIFRFLQNLAGERKLVDIVWPDTGMNGPLGIWLYSPILVISSYVFRIPIDIALRGLTLLCVPAIGWFLFRAFRNIWGERSAFWATILFLVTPYFTIHNHLAMGEVWYTLGLAVSLDYLTRDFRKKNIHLAFLFFGIGLAYKFTYAPLAILPVSHVLVNWKEIKPKWGDILLGAVLLFCGVLPLIAGILLDGPGFLVRFGQMSSYTADNVGSAAIAAWHNVSYGLGIPLILLALAGSVRVFLPGDLRQRKLGAIALLSTVVPVASLLFMKVLSFRYYYPLLIPVSMLAAGGIDWAISLAGNKNPWRLRLISALLAILIVGQAGYSFSREVFESHGGPGGTNLIVKGHSVWKQAAIYALENSREDDIIVTVNPGSFYIFGKRPMALNPVFSGFRKDGESRYLDYNMSGLREFELNASVRYFVLPEATLASGEVPPDLLAQLEPVWNQGSVGVYRYGEPTLSENSPTAEYRFDLRTIVKGFFKQGLMAPGRLKNG